MGQMDFSFVLPAPSFTFAPPGSRSQEADHFDDHLALEPSSACGGKEPLKLITIIMKAIANFLCGVSGFPGQDLSHLIMSQGG